MYKLMRAKFWLFGPSIHLPVFNPEARLYNSNDKRDNYIDLKMSF